MRFSWIHIDRIFYDSSYIYKWSAILLNQQRLKDWTFGIKGSRLRVENIYMHYVDLYYEGASLLPFPTKPKLKEVGPFCFQVTNIKNPETIEWNEDDSIITYEVFPRYTWWRNESINLNIYQDTIQNVKYREPDCQPRQNVSSDDIDGNRNQ